MYCNRCLARAHRIGSRANIVDLGGMFTLHYDA